MSDFTPEFHPVGDGDPQKFAGIIDMTNSETGENEKITITVEGFNDPAAGVIGLMRFTQEVIKTAVSMGLGPHVAINVLSEMGAPEEVIEAAKALAMLKGMVNPSMCDEHAEELAEKLGASTIADDAERFLQELNGQ